MKYANHRRYIEKLRYKLLAAGTQGLSQYELNQVTRTKVFSSNHMLEQLEEWEMKGWVQKFRVKGISKHPKTMWRATTALRDEWSRFTMEQYGQQSTGMSDKAPDLSVH